MDAEIKALRMKYKSLPDRSIQLRNVIGEIRDQVESIVDDGWFNDVYGVDHEVDRINSMFWHLGRGGVDDLEDAIRYSEQLITLLPSSRRNILQVGRIRRLQQEGRSLLTLLEKQEWNSGTVVNIAKEILRNSDWELCPILADALEDAGYNDQAVLRTLRSGASNYTSLQVAVQHIAGS